ncbi:MAG: hypothetical protein K0R08_2186 [Solimicrobium sp.]|jgi:hypothetical protein|nr:hypothetical protein [Solimicrobium sp.]
MIKKILKLGALITFFSIASNMQAHAANVYFHDHAWYIKYVYVMKPDSKEYALVPEEDWGGPSDDKKIVKKTEELPIGSKLCVSVMTFPTYLRASYDKYYFRVTRDGSTNLAFRGTVFDHHYDFYKVKDAEGHDIKDANDQTIDDNFAGLILIGNIVRGSHRETCAPDVN